MDSKTENDENLQECLRPVDNDTVYSEINEQAVRLISILFILLLTHTQCTYRKWYCDINFQKYMYIRQLYVSRTLYGLYDRCVSRTVRYVFIRCEQASCKIGYVSCVVRYVFYTFPCGLYAF